VRAADTVIDNSGALEATWGQVLTAWNAIPSAPHWPADTPFDATALSASQSPSARPAPALRPLWRAAILTVGMAALTLVASGGAGLSLGQRAWFCGLAAVLGLACSWLMGWE
jgi:hypothetical protein